MQRETIHSRRLTLVPLDSAQAEDLLVGEFGDLVAGAGWPHADTLDGIRAAVEATDADALPWLVQLTAGPDAYAVLDGPVVIGDLGWKGVPGPGGEVEIGYGIAGPYRRRGYGAEAVRALLGWLDARPDVTRLSAEVRADNVGSRRLLERLGFTLERVDGAYLWYQRPTPGRQRQPVATEPPPVCPV